ncbi:MAG: hypothetical protein AAGD18_05515 [Actinomycetota bacterium]
MDRMRFFRRRAAEEETVTDRQCPACGGERLEVVAQHEVTAVGEYAVTALPRSAPHRLRLIALCHTCGLVSDLGARVDDADHEPADLARAADLDGALASLRRAAGEWPALTRVVDAGRLWAHPDRAPLSATHRHWFTPGVLARTLRSAGMRVDAIQLDASGGLLAEVVDGHAPDPPFGAEAPVDDEVEAVRSYFARRREAVLAIRERVRSAAEDGGTPVIWGATPSTIALLDELGPDTPLEAVVDDDPRRIGQHLLGSGHPVIAPDDTDVKPTLVVRPDLAATAAAAPAFEAAGRMPDLI